MKKIMTYVTGLGLAISLLTMTGLASAAPTPTAPGQNKLKCFDGTTDTAAGLTVPFVYGGTCTVSNGARGPATLNNSSSAVDGDYSGVYVLNSTMFGVALSSVGQLGYNYTGTVTPLPGNLSLNVPVDTDGAIGTTEGYLFIDAYYCPGTDGHVDVINDPDCGIWFNGIFYENWAAVLLAYPTAKVADNYPFIVAERTPSEPAATWTVNAVKFGSVK